MAGTTTSRSDARILGQSYPHLRIAPENGEPMMFISRGQIVNEHSTISAACPHLRAPLRI
jgi:hypothetical protein